MTRRAQSSDSVQRLQDRLREIHESITNINADVRRRGALVGPHDADYREFVSWRGRAYGARGHLRAERKLIVQRLSALQERAAERHRRDDRAKLREVCLLAWHVVRATEARGCVLTDAERDLLRAAEGAMPEGFETTDVPSVRSWKAHVDSVIAEGSVVPLQIQSATTLVSAGDRMYSVETENGSVSDVSPLDASTDDELAEVRRLAERVAAAERDHNFALRYRAVKILKDKKGP